MEDFIESIGISSTLAGDIALFLALIAAGLALGFLIGRFRLMNFLLSILLSLVVLSVIPDTVISAFEYADLVIFIAGIVVFTLLDSNLFDLHFRGSAVAWWRAIILGFLEAGLILSILIQMLPRDTTAQLISSHAYGYFASPWAMFFWVIAPLAFLFLVNRRR